MKFIIVLLFSLMVAAPGKSQNIYMSGNSDIWELDLANCKVSFVIHVGVGFLDISFDSKGNLYGVTGKLYKINTINGALTKLKTFESSPLNAMVISAEDIVYMAGSSGELFSYNLNTEDSLFLGYMPFGAAGDLTFYKGELYMAAHDNKIVKVNIENPPASEMLFDFNHPSEVFGIVSDFTSCENVNCYAIAGGSNSDVFKIDFENKKLDFVCQVNKSIGGGASTTEFIASIAASVGDVIKTDADCQNQNGKLEFINTTGHGDVMYSLNNGPLQSSNIFSGLGQGIYSVVIIDQLGCKDSTLVELQQLPGPDILSLSAEPSVCNEANGAISVSASGGFGALTYSLDSIVFQSSSLFDQLTSRIYTVWVKDAAGCVVSDDIELESVQAAHILSAETSSTSCGKDNGSIEILVDNGVGTTYSLDGINFQLNSKFQNLRSQDYVITIRDMDGCVDTLSTNVGISSLPVIEVLNVTPASCQKSNGSVTVGGVDGIGPYEFALDNSGFQQSGNFDLLWAGFHAIKIRDSASCLNELSVTIEETDIPQILSLTIKPATCFQQNGSLDLDIQSFSSVSVSLRNMTNEVVTDFKRLGTGDYQLAIEDSAGCMIDTLITVGQADCPIYIPNVFSPNGDGINDNFIIEILDNSNVVVSQFSIFDRWGNLVFQKNGSGRGISTITWDGNFKNQSSMSGVYTYVMELDDQNHQKEILTGEITLVR